MIVSLLIGAVLAACGLAFVLAPLLFGPSHGQRLIDANGGPRGWVSKDAPTAEATAVDVLREIEFDRATGKLSDADYGTLKSAYTARALAELRSPVASPSERRAPSHEPATSHATTASTCGACDARTVAGAAYCINCGHYLNEQCLSCGAPVKLAAARFCSECGAALAAAPV